MDRIVHYSEGLEPEILQQIATEALPNTEMVTCYSKRRLVEALIDEPELVGVVVDTRELDHDWLRFIDSAMSHFPLLPVLVAHAAEIDSCPEGYLCVNWDADDATLSAALVGAFGHVRSQNRREHHRFDWPLRAELSEVSGTTYSIRELSAGGAFLVPVTAKPESGETHDIDIYFQNFKIRTQCTVLDARDGTDTRSPGFGIQFEDLSEPTREFINRVVEDAIVQTLTDPAAEPAVPSIDEEEDVLAIGDEFSLM